MSVKILKTIDMELSTNSISRAIREVRELRERLRETMTELVRKLTEEGVEIAKMQVVSMDAFDTGELEGSIGSYFIPAWGVGFVYAGAPYAVFVEYGTGIIGADSPHPGISDGDWKNPVVSMNGKTYDGYDSQHHGAFGWVYQDDKDGKFKWTAGYVSRPFMYHTLHWLEEAAPKRMSEMISQM